MRPAMVRGRPQKAESLRRAPLGLRHWPKAASAARGASLLTAVIVRVNPDTPRKQLPQQHSQRDVAAQHEIPHRLFRAASKARDMKIIRVADGRVLREVVVGHAATVF